MSARTPLARAITFCLIVLLIPSLAGSAHAQDSSSGFRDFLSCIQAEGSHLSVLMLFDESGSLSRPLAGEPATDPEDLRVTAAKALLRSLARLASPSAGSSGRSVEVALAGFSEEFIPTGAPLRWTTLDGSTVGDVESSVDTFRDKDRGLDTDFYHALAGAQRALAEHAASGAQEGPTCQGLVLFTDGKYSIDTRDDEKDYAPGIRLSDNTGVANVIRKGIDGVCGSEGASAALALVDRLRNDKVAIITVALAPTLSDEASAFIRSMSVGGAFTASGRACGQVAPTGAAFTANDSGELLDVFVGIGNSIAGGTDLPIDGPDGGVFGFSVNEVYSEVRILAETTQSSSAGTIAFRLTPPSGEAPLLVPYSTSGVENKAVGGARATYTWPTAQALDLAIELPGSSSASWTGPWTMELIDAGGAVIDALDLVVPEAAAFSRYQPELRGTDAGGPFEFTRGVASDLTVVLVDRTEDPLQYRPDLGPARLEAGEIQASDGSQVSEVTFSEQAADGTFTLVPAFTPAENLKSSVLYVTFDLVIAVPADGVELRPAHATLRAILKPPPNYPRILEDALDFGGLTLKHGEDPYPRTRTLTIEAGDNPGCVWFSAGPFDVRPQGVSGAVFSTDPVATDEATCIPIAPGDDPIPVKVSLTPREAGLGTLHGSLIAHLLPDGPGEALEIAIPTTLAMTVEPKGAVLFFLFILLFGLGLGGPIGLQYFLANRAARFQPTSGMWHARVPVVVDAGGVSRLLDDGKRREPLGFDVTRDMTMFRGGSSDPAREVALSPVMFLARRNRIPLLPPFGTVADAAGRAVITRSDRTPSLEARVPLELASEWIFVADPFVPVASTDPYASSGEGAAPEVNGSIHFLSWRAMPRQLADLSDEISRALPPLLPDLVAMTPALEVEQGTWVEEGFDNSTVGWDEGGEPW